MQTDISLQAPYQYSKVSLMIVTFLTIAIGSYFIYIKIKSKWNQTKKIEVAEIFEKNKKNIPAIKQKHLNQLNGIEKKYNDQKIDLRLAYQLISENVRTFVFEVTDITTQNYSLEEIKKLDMPKLYELIKEYYEPEFASKSVGDFKESINRARGIINEWN